MKEDREVDIIAFSWTQYQINCKYKSFSYRLWWFLKEAKNLKHLEVTDNVRITGKVLSADYLVL